jgi:5-oxoprolinase (ATP-hydrolysing)
LPGSDTSIDVDWSTPDRMSAQYANAHRRLYGVQAAADELVIASVGVEALERAPDESAGRADRAVITPLEIQPAKPGAIARRGTVSLWIDGAWCDIEAHERSELQPEQTVRGPMLVSDPGATIWIACGWSGALDRSSSLVLERGVESTTVRPDQSIESNPQRLEVFNGIYMHAAEQMGAVLRQTASSVNIKERLDFSCAIFDARSGLVANAPHMPVHLGSMGASVAAVVERFGDDLRPGDAYLLNSPYEGGTHLPDLTVVTPVFDAAGSALIAFVASRAHHADIGGVTPGSMPPWSRSIDDEGVLIEPLRILRDGVLDEAGLRARFRDNPHPARDPDRNVADLRAQLAANACGLRELERAAGELGQDVLVAYMSHVQDNAERCMRRAIRELSDGEFRYQLDNGQVIAVRISVDASAGHATVDFTGTSPQLDNNLNAPLAVTTAAVLYAFRTLIDEPIPINAGCLRPLSITVPRGCMLDPTWPSAVVAGNVETSQCIVDALYGALGLQAAAQGTMNNFTFGNDHYQYYETIAGGSGAGPHHDGASGVQTHMTNSRLTDPEVLEHRFPVRVREFALRRGSGGRGRHRGGDGLVRSVEFLEAMTVAILSNHRRVAPFGLAGGEPGAVGINRVARSDGRRESLAGSVQIRVEPGDVVTLETPGGGGYGEPDAA